FCCPWRVQFLATTRHILSVTSLFYCRPLRLLFSTYPVMRPLRAMTLQTSPVWMMRTGFPASSSMRTERHHWRPAGRCGDACHDWCHGNFKFISHGGDLRISAPTALCCHEPRMIRREEMEGGEGATRPGARPVIGKLSFAQ